MPSVLGVTRFCRQRAVAHRASADQLQAGAARLPGSGGEHLPSPACGAWGPGAFLGGVAGASLDRMFSGSYWDRVLLNPGCGFVSDFLARCPPITPKPRWSTCSVGRPQAGEGSSQLERLPVMGVQQVCKILAMPLFGVPLTLWRFCFLRRKQIPAGALTIPSVVWTLVRASLCESS